MSKLRTQNAPVYDAFQCAQLLGEIDPVSAPEAREGFITFFDPGWSILRLRQSFANGGFFFPQSWYDNEPFARFEEEPRYRQLRMEPVPGSLNKSFAKQQDLLIEHEIPYARVVLMGMFIHFMATRERLFPDCYVRCVDQRSNGDRVYVGHFDCDGFRVLTHGDDYWDDNLGLASSRKL